MAKLVSLTPCAGLLPITVGAMTVAELEPGAMFSVAPFAGQAKAVTDALKAQVGTGLSKPGRRTGAVTWFGHGTWLVAGALDAAPLAGLAAVTDQSDAWAVVDISGPGVEDVLARLVPVDLRAAVFKKNDVARTLLAHLSVVIVRSGPQAFEITVMRSMAATLVHDLDRAMRGVSARDVAS